MKSGCFQRIRLCSILLVTVVTAGIILPGRASAGNKDSAERNQLVGNIQVQPLVTNDHDGSQVLEEMTARVKKLGPYSFEGALSTLKEKDLKQDLGSFYYMPQSCLRVEVKGKGYKAGSILVKQKDGVIRAKGGPSLLGMKVNLEPDSNMLRLANGLNIINCDYLSLINWLKGQIASGQKVYASDGPMNLPTQSKSVLVLETREAGKTDGLVAHRILIDPKTFVPVEWDIFREGRFFSTVRFNDFKLCPTLDESLFQI